MSKKLLTDIDAYDRLHAALQILDEDKAETTRANTALEAARKALTYLQLGLLKAIDDNTDHVEGIIPSDDLNTQ